MAIIGGGAACISFLFHFVELHFRRATDTRKILVFEKERPVGPGLAYQEDHADLILNRVAETMSISPANSTLFAKWMVWKANYSREIHEATGGSFPDVYLPRRLFGRFLRDSFREIQNTAAEHGVVIEVIREAIVRIDRSPELRVHSRTGSWAAGNVVLATGHTNPKDHYGLSGHNRYIHSAYPVSDHLEKLRSASSICILGASLTAIDVAVSLQSADYRGRIDMLSRRGLLPYVKGNSYPPHVLQHLTELALKRITDDGISKVSLRSVLRLLRRELHSVGVSWKMLFANEYPDAKDHLDAQIESAGEIRPWAPIFRAINGLVHDLWNSLDEASQHIFLRRFSRRWMSIRTPIPIQNAKRLQAMMRTGQLRVSSGPATFSVVPCGRLEMTRQDGSKRHYDAVVNATGTAASVDGPPDSELIWSLVQSGIAAADARGGVKVDFASGALISDTGAIDRSIRAVGHVTSGTYFYVDSLDMISRQAQRIAADLMENICGDSHGIASQRALEIPDSSLIA
ncbi:hypothetical protein R75461_08411 [Paraburkholderia nemoris]|uniref:FAD/NAD(P)-binding protein n=1 Tax=Paraburkholderia nemoris TaxID=2793076 RepID=UPI00190E0FCC|nr:MULTISPECIES: FAD/NAD(P)-binding protein [Paraburkholderia]MBK3787181.1 FAD-dependent oxidoreductase [Paraburkholderia aspalathi]CAE6868142.1 hypothetical protein R75461_08411 [Paraburkholderia nemoris]